MEKGLERGSSGQWEISGSTLKMIAVITMFIDHIGAVVVERILIAGPQVLADMGLPLTWDELYQIYEVMRYIGRLAFPIFCFLMTEGFCHTRNRRRYAGRLFLFVLISEIPFDLALSGKIFYPDFQNVFFTLLLGFLVMTGMEWIEEHISWADWGAAFLKLVIVFAGIGCAEFLNTDYGGMGVLTIIIMYVLRQWKLLAAASGCTVLTCMNSIEVTAYAILVPIFLYEGRRGWNLKWIFYLFYPMHLFLLYLFAVGIGLGDVRLR